MYKKTALFLITAVFIIGISKISFAMKCDDSATHSKHLQVAQASDLSHDHEEVSKATSSATGSVHVGNKVCPVMGDKINEDTKATYEYEGKVYNFCCGECIEEFKKNPAKYIKIIEQEKNIPQSITTK